MLWARLCSLALAGVSLAGLMIVNTPIDSQAANAPSTLTIKWNGDTGTAASYQPPRVTSSVHYNDFRNLEVTVSQTADLGDQAIRISVTGMAATKASEDGAGRIWSAAQNFMQAMQCWGDPESPDFDFRETCQWGGRAFTINNGLGDSVYRDNRYTLYVVP